MSSTRILESEQIERKLQRIARQIIEEFHTEDVLHLITIAGNGIVAVRYAWSDVPADANVVNADGLPMAPFRWTKLEW